MMLFLYFVFLLSPVRSESIDKYTVRNHNENISSYDTNYQQNFRRYSGNELSMHYCNRTAKCIKMNNTLCMGTKLSYDTTSLEHLPFDSTLDAITATLDSLQQSLRLIPKCWLKVQPLMCSLFMPKCINDTVYLPSYKMCTVMSGPCKIIFGTKIWPNYIRCEDSRLFPLDCKNDLSSMKFNNSQECLQPLIPTDNSLAVFEGIEGCGVPCSDPLYTDDEKNQIHAFISWTASICCFFSFFTVMTFIVDWRSAQRYPALAMFYLSLCFMTSSIGWLAQFFTKNSRNSIVCKKDGTVRMSEPSGEDLSCVIVFVLIYYSLIAAMIWFVILTYTWHMNLNAQSFGKMQDRIDKKDAYFHLLAWCLPLVLTVMIMASSEIDGNYVTGICFVGYNNPIFRIWFVLVPILISVLIGGYFLIRGFITLISLKSSIPRIAERIKIREYIIRMGLFSGVSLVAVIITIYCHIYDFNHSWLWKQSFRKNIICLIVSQNGDVSECKTSWKIRPSAAKLQLHLLAPFLAGISILTWILTGSTVDTWMRFFKRTLKQKKEPSKLKKHTAIALMYAKMKKLHYDVSHCSISFHSTHQDPFGVNIDLDAVSSEDFYSSTWAMALPRLVTRRGALAEESFENSRRNSVDSQISVISVRHLSIESRRNSSDSQFAMSYSEIEMKTDFKTRTTKGSNRDRKKPKKLRKRYESCRRVRKDIKKSSSNKIMPSLRRGSATSQESQSAIQVLSARSIRVVSDSMPLQVPNMKRRAAIDQESIAFKDVEKSLPFLLARHSNSEDSLSNEEKQTIDGDFSLTIENENKDDNKSES